MRHIAGPWRGIVIAAACLSALLGPRAARAAVDLTGNWRVVFYQVGPPALGTFYPSFAQTGNQLTITRDAPMASGVGTIDPQTGVFSFDFGPYTDPSGPPGPTHFLTGTATPNGLFFGGQENVCIFEIGLGWGCLTFDLQGTPGEPPVPVCGNGDIDVGEECDLGAFNGLDNCCTTSCTIIDPDGDGICSMSDLCPRTADPSQSDLDNDQFGDACDPSTIGWSLGYFESGRLHARISLSPGAPPGGKRLVLMGAYSGVVTIPTTIQMRDVDGFNLDLAALPAWQNKQCKHPSASRAVCTSPDRSLTFKMRRDPNVPGLVEIRLVLKNPPLTGPIIPPLATSVHSPDGGRRTYSFGCKRRGNGGVSCKD